ncbi:hypothetical protein FA13DRAFT_162848 [Coprinellus micaceus]|uniref:Uncharacterized protein n=1 Tax=Coprinellus micaceus TaxID=71717 RepID=A0A4Y7THG7_COPMI|nr:hypothetical protein FA13DRAFT_162848 [Coprinellus micaceus]
MGAIPSTIHSLGGIFSAVLLFRDLAPSFPREEESIRVAQAYVLRSAPSHIGFPVGHSLNHTCALPLRRPGLYPPLWGRRRLAQALGLNKGYN